MTFPERASFRQRGRTHLPASEASSKRCKRETRHSALLVASIDASPACNRRCTPDLSTSRAGRSHRGRKVPSRSRLCRDFLSVPAHHGRVTSLLPVRRGLLRTRHPTADRSDTRLTGEGFSVDRTDTVSECRAHRMREPYHKWLCLSNPQAQNMLWTHSTWAYSPLVAELPTCANFLSRTCERSDVYVSKETDSAFVIACRTCRSVNVWPKDKDENAGRYQAFLKHQAAREA